MEKMTNIKALEYVLANVELPTEVSDKLANIKASFEKKANADRKPTANQTENVNFKNDIVEFMEIGKSYTISELMKSVPSLNGISNQRVSAIVKQLVDANIVVRTEIKRKAYFSLAQ